MKKSLFKTLFLAAVGMTVCLGANAQKLGADAVAATNADPSLQVGDDFYYGEIFDYTILSVESGSGEVTYTVAVKGLLPEYPAEEVVDLVIPAGDSFTYNGTAYTFTVVGITAFEGYEEVQSLTIPASVESVAGVADLAGLGTIYVEAETPATAAEDAFDDDIYENVTLVTPEGKMGKYGADANAGGWYNFLKVESTSGAKLGDATNDGKANVFDVIALKTYLEDEDEYPLGNEEAGDVTSDGKINVFDIIALKLILEK